MSCRSNVNLVGVAKKQREGFQKPLYAWTDSTYLLHNRAGGSADDINQTYTVNLSSEPANGTWKLRVQDAAGGDIGRIDSWTINL